MDKQLDTIPVTGTGTLTETPVEKKVFPPFDATTFASQLFWFALTFLIFYWLMAKVALPRIGGILEGRKARIANDLGQAEQAKRQSEEAGAAYEKALAEARARAFGIADAARNTSKAASDAQRTSIEADLAKKLAAAEARIADIKSRALAEVGTIAGDAAGAVVSALSDVETSATEIEDAVKSALAERNAHAV
jgi:F-type H+-transporting ATPase subunit b